MTAPKPKAKPAVRPVRDTRRQIAALPWRDGEDGLRILLITSRRTQRWVVPKGWPMEGLKAHQAAAQEAYEEAGIRGEIAPKAIGAFHYLKLMKRGHTQLCKVDVFPMQVLEQDEIWPEHDQRTLQWFTVEEAVAQVEEPELAELILAFGLKRS